MTKPMYKTLAIIILFIVGVVGLFVWRMTSPVFIDKAALEEAGIFIYPQPRAVPTLSLIDHNGKPFTNEQLQGKWTFIFFGFTSCGAVCPTSLAQLSLMEQRVKKDQPAQYMFFSIDPARDTPARINEYINAFNKNFVGVVAQSADLPGIGAALNVIVDVPKAHQHDHGAHQDHAHHTTPQPTAEIDHSANIVIINPKGQYHGFIRGGFQVDKVVPLIPAVIRSM